MSDCYLCGAYIERGRGYRREVHTGTSARFYMTRWGGTSVGAQFGLRTVCARCADQIDRLREGTAGRCLLYSLGYLLSAYVGWQLLVSGSPVLGIICLVGLPIGAVAWMAEAVRRSAIVKAPFSLKASSETLPQIEPWGARREDESVGEWVERTLVSTPELDRRLVEGYAEHYAPPVGLPLATWIKSWPEWNPEWDPAIAVKTDVFRADDHLLG